jgi:hypothetical protein
MCRPKLFVFLLTLGVLNSGLAALSYSFDAERFSSGAVSALQLVCVVLFTHAALSNLVLAVAVKMHRAVWLIGKSKQGMACPVPPP